MHWPRAISGDIPRRIGPHGKNISTLTDGNGGPRITSRRIEVEQKSCSLSGRRLSAELLFQ